MGKSRALVQKDETLVVVVERGVDTHDEDSTSSGTTEGDEDEDDGGCAL